jgi:hypothetical protein
MHDIFATFLMLKYHCCMILTFNINKIIIHIFKWHSLLFFIIFFHLIINFHITIAIPIPIHIHSHIIVIIIIISIIFRFNLLIRSSYIILTIIYIMITISYTTMITIITFCMLFIIFIFF